MKRAGKVYLVGAGPGDPDLITNKGLKLLKTCDVVIYDRLVSDRLLNYVKKDCVKIYVGKTVGSHKFHQEEINQIIIEQAFLHPVVVRLKGGDPFVFGRGGEEVLALKEQEIRYEVIPGVTSAIAAATYAGIPITHRGSSQSFHVITGHTAEEEVNISKDLKAFAQMDGTLVILMGIGNIDKIRDELLSNGKSKQTPVAVISNGTTPCQKEVKGTLDNICEKVRESGMKAPAVIVIGSVAELDMKPTIRYPLSGVSVGITGTQKITDKLTTLLEEQGASVALISSSTIYQYENNMQFDHAIQLLEQYQWLVLTSTNAVQLFFEKMLERKIDHRRLSHIKFAVVGSGTEQALWQHGYQADLIPATYTVAHLAKELCEIINKEDRLLIPRANQGSEELIDILNNNHIVFDDIKIYDVINSDTTREHQKDLLQQIDYLTFASSSGVHGLLKDSVISPVEMLENVKVVCIGEATMSTLQEYDYYQAILAKEASVIGLVERICEEVEASNI